MYRTHVQIVRFLKNDFFVDISDLGDSFEAWIHKKDLGIAELMFSMPKKQSYGEITFEHFCELVDANFDEYAGDYMNRYCEDY